jgi:aldehyde reductase
LLRQEGLICGHCNLDEAPNLLEDRDVIEMAGKYKKTPFQIVLRWGLDRGHVVIPKATAERKHINENFNIHTC